MTRLHINAIIGLFVMGGLALGLLWILIQSNGTINDTRFLHIAGLMGVCIWGIRETTKYFAGVPVSCPKCHARLDSSDRGRENGNDETIG